MTQINRANAFLELGERKDGAKGLDYLQQAVAAYDLALEIRTREAMPAQWATTQMNRAIALDALAKLKGE